MEKKVSPVYEIREVVYDERRWLLLKDLRGNAMAIMNVLYKRGVEAIAHGSIARGDVNEKSDIDIFIPDVIPSYIIEGALHEGGFEVCRREMTQATPNHVVKAILYLDEKVKVTFPLLPLRQREREFYKFGGEVGLNELHNGRRVPGVDKRLMMIIPTSYGHYEYSIIRNSVEVSRVIGVSLELVRERIRVLTRRDEIGRTGIYFKAALHEGESFEAKMKERAAKDPSLRRLLSQRGARFIY
ncbi:MAG: nucleotidyltransferase domain-containing protein [Candidatus Methanomethylicaceae archaeon]